MDVIIPGHSVRTFASSVSCLSKIGKDLYCDFDAIDGLALRALNDAKSAFCCVEFAPSFFERCTTPVTAIAGRKRDHASASSNASQEARFSCRIPMRALAPVVRPRKGVVSLRIKSQGHAGSENNNDDSNASLQLAFEFHLEVANQSGQGSLKPTMCKVLHKMGVAEVDNIAAVAPKDECSEIVAAPKVLLKWLEPIKRTSEACLIFQNDSEMVVATSFNSTDTSDLANSTKTILKTETSINLEDLYDYDFRDHREIESQATQDPVGGMPAPCPMPPNVNEKVVLVFGMKEAKALLQFCSQNASLVTNLGFDDLHEDDRNGRPWSVSLSFHWAGRPMIWESKAKGVSVQLVLATLSHSILKDLPVMQQEERPQPRQQQQQARRQS